MSSAQQIWSQYETQFKQTVNQAQKQEEIEQYFYIFTTYLSQQKYDMKTIEDMRPLIREAVDDVIKVKFRAPQTPVDMRPSIFSDQKESMIPILAGQPEDRVVFETDLRVYNRLAKWINRENANMQYKILKRDSDKSRGKYKGKMWLKSVDLKTIPDSGVSV